MIREHGFKQSLVANGNILYLFVLFTLRIRCIVLNQLFSFIIRLLPVYMCKKHYVLKVLKDVNLLQLQIGSALSSQKYRCMLCLLSPCVGHLSNLGNFENTHEARVALMVLKGLLTSERIMCNANS